MQREDSITVSKPSYVNGHGNAPTSDAFAPTGSLTRPRGSSATTFMFEFEGTGSLRAKMSVAQESYVSAEVSHQPFKALVDKLCEKYPSIGIDERVLGGAPHIKGTRLSVARILTSIYHLNNIDAVIDEFKQRINKKQIKEAIAYAHDFMEMACDPSEDDD
jgi:uncharacterized protein (DUF433 family)